MLDFWVLGVGYHPVPLVVLLGVGSVGGEGGGGDLLEYTNNFVS